MLYGLTPSAIVQRLIAVILAMSIHEFAHGLVSYWFGDPTAKMRGRLSLNPLNHIDWTGLVCLLLFQFGWAKPVPIDPDYYKDPKTGIIWTSFAGPVANFLLTFVAMFLYYLIYKVSPSFAYSGAGKFILDTLATTAIVSTGFGVFNLIPVPPLDGSKILFAFLPDESYYRAIRGNPMMYYLFIALLLLGVLNGPLMMARNGIIQFISNLCIHLLGL